MPDPEKASGNRTDFYEKLTKNPDRVGDRVIFSSLVKEETLKAMGVLDQDATETYDNEEESG